jgi:hypothetical protein
MSTGKPHHRPRLKGNRHPQFFIDIKSEEMGRNTERMIAGKIGGFGKYLGDCLDELPIGDLSLLRVTVFAKIEHDILRFLNDVR